MSPLRPWQGLAAVIWAIGLGGCGVTMFDPNEIDPTAPRVVPQVGDDAAVIETSAPEDFLTPGVEGSVLFVRLTDPAGTLVLDRPFDWPTDEQRVPPGDYTMLLYFRGCDGNCSRLSREAPFCEHEITLVADDRLRIAIESMDLGPGMTCTIGPL